MKKIPWDLIRILCFLLFFGLFYLIPVQAVESGSICLLYRMTGYLCPGCGVTRGFVNFLHLDFSKAFSYQKTGKIHAGIRLGSADGTVRKYVDSALHHQLPGCVWLVCIFVCSQTKQSVRKKNSSDFNCNFLFVVGIMGSTAKF